MRLILWCLCLLVCLPASAAELQSIRIEPGRSGEHVMLELTSRTKVRIFRVESPPVRIAVDMAQSDFALHAGLPAGYRGRLVKNIRFGRPDDDTARAVFDLSQDSEPRNIRYGGSQREGYRVEFDLPFGGGPQSIPVTGKKTPHPLKVKAASKPKPDQRPMVVIDAGHGGQDPGTAGQDGSEEKDLTLRYAKALQQTLLKTGRYRVTLTRDGDYYLLLRERVRRARTAHGDLFLSLHADSAPTRSARGLSVYTISEKSSDKQSELLAAQENHADVIGGMDLSGASADVAGILIDLASRETRAKSAEFADLAIKYLGPQVGLLSNTHRFAGFAVLKAPDIPSVLVEIGFLTNPKEEAQLKSRVYEMKVVHGLAQAVGEFFK